MEANSEPYAVTKSWAAPDGSDWVLTFRLKTLGGRPECVGMDIASLGDRAPLRSQTLRALPFAGELEQALQAQLDRDGRLKDLARRMGGRVPELESSPLTTKGTPRRRARYTVKDYERVAQVYRERCELRSKTPTHDTAEILGLRYQQAAKLIQRCREERYSLLPPTGITRGSKEEGE